MLNCNLNCSKIKCDMFFQETQARPENGPTRGFRPEPKNTRTGPEGHHQFFSSVPSGCITLSSGGLLFCVQCLWVRSKQRKPDESGPPRVGMWMECKRKEDAKRTRSCQERYFYCTVKNLKNKIQRFLRSVSGTGPGT